MAEAAGDPRPGDLECGRAGLIAGRAALRRIGKDVYAALAIGVDPSNRSNGLILACGLVSRCRSNDRVVFVNQKAAHHRSHPRGK